MDLLRIRLMEDLKDLKQLFSDLTAAALLRASSDAGAILLLAESVASRLRIASQRDPSVASRSHRRALAGATQPRLSL